jgi:hypothetical protein
MKLKAAVLWIALCLLISACAQPTSSVMPQNGATATVKRDTTTTTVWLAGDPVLGNWEPGDDEHQCGTPVQSGTTFTMTLTRDGNNCNRNQATPLLGQTGGLVFLTPGIQYTWTWHEVDGLVGLPVLGMGPDTDARSLVWQIHGLDEPDSPCTELAFYNNPAQTRAFTVCGITIKTLPYTPTESDDWKVVAIVCDKTSCPPGISPETKLYRNNVLMVDYVGQNAHNGKNHKYWWNFGPYKWPWSDGTYTGSMTFVSQTFSNMKLTTP